MSNSKVLTSKSSAISKVYNDEVINAVKSYAFIAKKAYGSCALSGQPISKGDKCEMLIQADGNKVTILQSTTVAKGKKAEKVRSTSKKPSKKVEKAVSTPKATKTKSPFSFAKASVNSVAVREALVSLALASDKEKQSILEALPLNVALTIIDLTK